MNKIGIVNIQSFGREYPEVIRELEEKVGPVKKFNLPYFLNGKELASELRGYTYLIVGTNEKFNEEFFANDPDVRLVARHGLGYDNVDVEAAKRHGVYVTREDGITERDAVAEQAVALLNAVAKCTVKADAMVRSGEWAVHRERIMGFQLLNSTTGIIGCGNIGRRVGEIMKYGYHNRVLAYDPYQSKAAIEQSGFEACSLETLLKESDYVSLHCNLTAENTGMINAQRLALMKPTAILINTARGSLVQEAALVQALKEKKLFGYGTDVAVKEPIEPENELLKLDHVVITPHSAVYNLTCEWNMNQKVMKDIYLMEAGKKPELIVNGL